MLCLSAIIKETEDVKFLIRNVYTKIKNKNNELGNTKMHRKELLQYPFHYAKNIRMKEVINDEAGSSKTNVVSPLVLAKQSTKTNLITTVTWDPS